MGIPLLRFHPHPSQCRSIGQTIGLTAYPPQRAAIFMMLPRSNLPRLFRLGALFEPLDIPTTCGAYCPFRDCIIRPSRSGVCQPFKLQGLAYSTTTVGSLRSRQLGHSSRALSEMSPYLAHTGALSINRTVLISSAVGGSMDILVGIQ